MIPKEFRDDERAIEGLPIRLVIALVVGVAALALMMNLLGTFQFGGETEVNWETQSGSSSSPNIHNNIVGASDGDPHQIKMKIVDENGNTLEGGQVLIKSGSAQLGGQGPITKTIPDNGRITVNLGSGRSDNKKVDLRPDQDKGTLKVEIIPPSDSNYVDNQENEEIVVVPGQA